MELPVAKCGSQGFECAIQGLGCMGMSMFYGDFKSDESRAEIDKVFEEAAKYKGIMLDTSDMYGPRTNEILIGEQLKKYPGVFKIATKCGIDLSDGTYKLNCSPEYIKKCCQGSLDRLGVDCIDLYYLHRYDQKTPIEDVMRAFKELVEEGKVKYVGVSELSIPLLRRAHAVFPISAYQMEWSIFTRDVEAELVPVCRELGIGIVAYSPLGRGMLTGAIKSLDDVPADDRRRNLPRFAEYLEDNNKLVECVEQFAAEKGCTTSQLAIAWVHAQGPDVFPIPGTKKVGRFLENLASLNVKLTEEDMKKLEELSAKVAGGRYSKSMQHGLFDSEEQLKCS